MGEWGEYDSKEGIQAGEVKLPPQQHQLQQTMPSKTELLSLEYEWVLWYDEGSPKGQSYADYENSMKRLGSFATIQDFWRYWNNIVDIAKFPDYSNLRMFKVGIKPMWEDRANIEGGKWVVQCNNKEQTNTFTIKVVLAIIGEQFEHGEDICGIVLSLRPKGDTLNIWNRCGRDSTIICTTTAQLAQLIEAPAKYQAHREAITYNKSFHAKSPKVNHHSNPQQLPLRVSADELINSELGGMQGSLNSNSMSTGVLSRNHPAHNKALPFLDLDGIPSLHSRGKSEDAGFQDKVQNDSNKNKVGLEHERDFLEERPLPTQSQLRRHNKDKHHKKSKSMSVVEAQYGDYPPYSTSTNPMRRSDVQMPLIVPPLPIITPPIPGLPSPSFPPQSSNTSFRKQHRKSASVSVESSSVHSHPKTHSRTPSSDAARKHSSKSPLPTSSSFNSSAVFNTSSSSRGGNKVRLSPTLLPVDTKKHSRTPSLEPNSTIYSHRHRNSIDREMELHTSTDNLPGGSRPSSKLKRTPVDDLIIDDVVVKELLGDGDEEEYEISLAEDSFRPRAFAPVARRPSIKDGKDDAEKDRKKKSRVSRKDSLKSYTNVFAKKSSSTHMALVNAKTFFVEHLPLVGMILGICLITVVLQQW